MNRTRIGRAVPVILGGSGAFAGGSLARGASPAEAAGAGLFVALAATGLIAALLMVRRVGRATRRDV
jgi:hypothetical protein